jgi:hypothetical protein
VGERDEIKIAKSRWLLRQGDWVQGSLLNSSHYSCMFKSPIKKNRHTHAEIKHRGGESFQRIPGFLQCDKQDDFKGKHGTKISI